MLLLTLFITTHTIDSSCLCLRLLSGIAISVTACILPGVKSTLHGGVAMNLTSMLRADVLKMTIWQTPAGIVDEGGFVLPSWLNFGITLLGPPANGVMHVSTTPPCQKPFSMHRGGYTM